MSVTTVSTLQGVAVAHRIRTVPAEPAAAAVAHMPSDVSADISIFDRFAGHAAIFASKAWFFALCVILVIVWAPSFFLIRDIDTWQLIINTVTTIITFLLVALLQNTQSRGEMAVQDKLNAIAKGLADLMTAIAEDKPGLDQDIVELIDAVGLETREST
jgi:low affinity Fe/Cu permease